MQSESRAQAIKRLWAGADAGLVAVQANLLRGEATNRVIALDRRRSSRLAAGACGVALGASAVGWLVFCLTAKPGPGAARGAEVMLLLLSLVSLPMLAYARRLLRDAVSGGEIVIDDHVLSIFVPRILRSPITLDRALVAGVIVEHDAVGNRDERLRFAVDDDATYLYSSITGSSFPILSAERAVPNLAIVFEQPLQFPDARRRSLGAEDFAPLRPLQPDAAAPGLLLRVSDPRSALQALDAWVDPGRVSGALASAATGDWPGSAEAPALRRPMEKDRTRPRWPALRIIGVVFALVYVGRHGSLSFAEEAVLLGGFASFLTGAVLDTQFRYQERTGLARVLSVGLAAAGLMLAISITTISMFEG